MNAIGYIRISEKDQSTYSLPYQESRIRDYCVRNGLYLKEIFEDNGESSATFDRPDYLALEKFIKAHKGEVQYLIVLDHDRFSRILVDALRKIEELQKKFGLKVLSVEEPLNLDTTDPNVFLHRTFKYAFANHELLNIRRRTARGIRQAMESGRVVNRAPFGYVNSRDEHGKPVLIIDQEKAAVVKEIFEAFIEGMPLQTLRKLASKKGCKREGHSSLLKLLDNPLYAGLIRLPAFEGRPERYVKALHEPIILESRYWIVHELIEGRPGQKARPKADFPLRGILRCECGAHMTAGYSKGKKKYYLYYQCTKERGRNYRGELLHDMVEKVLQILSFTDEDVAQIKQYASEELTKATKYKTALLNSKYKEFNEVSLKIENLERKMINDEIEASTYKVWFSRLNAEKGAIENEIMRVKKDKQAIFDRLDEAIPMLCNLRNLYLSVTLDGQLILLNKVFELGIKFDGHILRTPSLNPALIDNYLNTKEKGLLIVEQPDDFLHKNLKSTA
ncbi:MAG TPA: recombinase family protein [Puia sp.]|nr:recombinase family protein [Puia sp.]